MHDPIFILAKARKPSILAGLVLPDIFDESLTMTSRPFDPAHAQPASFVPIVSGFSFLVQGRGDEKPETVRRL
jgi:hypothetical protein